MAYIKRFFIGLLPPLEMRSYANQIQQHFANHYASRTALNSPPHITLQSPFEWPLARRDELIERLTQFAQRPRSVGVTLLGFGAFAPRVIFINVLRSAALLALQADLCQHLASNLGVYERFASRPFAPHMTVAFRDLTKENFRQAWPIFAQKPLNLTNAPNHQYQFVVQSIVLLQHDGRVWQVDREVIFRRIVT